IEEFLNEKMIWREANAGIRKIIEKFLSEHNILDKISSNMEFGTIQAIKSAVEADLGIAILPKLSVMRELEQGVLKKVAISNLDRTRELWMVKKTSRFSNENVDRLIDFIMSQMRVLLTLLNKSNS